MPKTLPLAYPWEDAPVMLEPWEEPGREALTPRYTAATDGCHLHRTCLTCPLETCIFDVKAKAVRIDARRERQDRLKTAVAARYQATMLKFPTNLEAAASCGLEFNLSARTVLRYVREVRDGL